MRTISVGLAALALTGLAACASAPQDKPADASAQKTIDDTELAVTVEKESSKDAEDRVICTRRVATGSHRKTRYCRTRAQRDQERRAAQDTLREVTTGGSRQVD